MKFAELPIPESVKRALAGRGYENATPVQQAVLAEGTGEEDLLVSSQTGSGKTVAFGLALAPRLLDEQGRARSSRTPLVLAVAPTRELALQVARELAWLYGPAGVRVASCVGGMDMRREMMALDAGAQVVVGTPGRVCDHLERKSLKLQALSSVVLDEADEMLEMGFREELERILGAAPTERRTLLFSATLPRGIEALAKSYTRDAKRISATSMSEPHADIDYLAHVIARRERDHAVVNVLRYYDAPSALVFCARRDQVAHMHASLLERGFMAEQLSGELSQAERNRALSAMREGRSRVLVATDVAARGLDLPAVGLVVHADLPHGAAPLLHRSGRTGRAGKKGVSVLLAPFAERRIAERLIRSARIEARWTPVPTAEQIRALDQRRLIEGLAKLVAEVTPEDLEAAREVLTTYPAEQIAAALLQKERRAYPAAEELPLSAAADRPAPPPRGRDERPPRREHDERPPRRERDERPPRRERFQKDASQARPHAPRPERGSRDAAPAWQGERQQENRPSAPPRETRAEVVEPERAPHDSLRRERPTSVQHAPRRERPQAQEDHPPRRHERPQAQGDHPPRRRERPQAQGDHPPRRREREENEAVWFRVNVGREKSADPRWLLPMLCRKGGVKKNDIGRIDIRAKDTRFEIDPRVAARFAEAVKRRDDKDPNIRIELAR